MKHKLLLLYAWLVRILLIWCPDMPIIMRFRGRLYSLGTPKAGSNFQVSANVIIKNLENCYFGRDVYLAPNVVINAIDDIKLESEVMIGFNSVLVSGNHSNINGSFRFGKSIKAPILIEKGAWVSANCTLTAGAKLPESSLLAANSVLTKSISEKFIILGGVPAKKIGTVQN